MQGKQSGLINMNFAPVPYARVVPVATASLALSSRCRGLLRWLGWRAWSQLDRGHMQRERLHMANEAEVTVCACSTPSSTTYCPMMQFGIGMMLWMSGCSILKLQDPGCRA